MSAEAEKTLQVTEQIIDFINHAVKYVMETESRDGNGVYGPDAQYAVRIFKAAKRRLWNEYDSRHADDPQMRLRATLALQLNDNGDLLSYGGINHARGLLDCTGCDFDYINMERQSLCVVCRFCKRGVEHVRTLRGPMTYPDKMGIVVVGEDSIIKWTQCDECGSRSIIPLERQPQSLRQ